MQPISYLGGVAAESSFSNVKHAEQLINITTKAGAAILVLLAITTFSVYKPWGKVYVEQANKKLIMHPVSNKRKMTFYILVALVILIFVLILKHLTGGGIPHQ